MNTEKMNQIIDNLAHIKHDDVKVKVVLEPLASYLTSLDLYDLEKSSHQLNEILAIQKDRTHLVGIIFNNIQLKKKQNQIKFYNILTGFEKINNAPMTLPLNKIINNDVWMFKNHLNSSEEKIILNDLTFNFKVNCSEDFINEVKQFIDNFNISIKNINSNFIDWSNEKVTFSFEGREKDIHNFQDFLSVQVDKYNTLNYSKGALKIRAINDDFFKFQANNNSIRNERIKSESKNIKKY